MIKPAINMQYRLLRNNKESGPYTKAQLEEMGLKPYDLLWIEGRGGAWLYASEIEELKSIAPTVEEQPYDRFFNKGKEKQTVGTNSKQNVSSINSVPTASNTATLKPPKPRFRISGDKVVMIEENTATKQQQENPAISTATKAQKPATVVAKPEVKQEIGAHIQSVGMDWEGMYSDWKGEENPQKEPAPAAPAKVQTMEDVKQRYEQTKLKQLNGNHGKTSGATRQNIMAAIAIMVLAIGGYAGYKLNSGGNDSNRTNQNAPVVEKAEVIQDANNQHQNTTDASTTSTTQQASDNTVETQPNEINNSLQASNSKATNKVPPPVENKTTVPDTKREQTTLAKNTPPNTVEKSNQKVAQQAQLTENRKGNTTAKNNGTVPANDNMQAEVKNANTNAPVQIPSVTQPSLVKEAPAKKINDYITVSKLGSSNNSSVQNVLLSVKNVTDFPIDLAVIDIQYYGANGRFQKGETMYVKNIEAGNNVNVRIPDSKTSRSITYKISLVSSEQKTLYLVGD
jgi:hypothetical protein